MPKNLFQGLCAFPLTPLRDQHIDEAAFTALLARLTDAGVDAMGLSLIHISEPTRRLMASRMPSSA